MVVSDPDKSLLGILGIAKTRLVSLQQGENRFGMMGLLEYPEPEMEVKPFVKRPGYPYEVLFVFLVDDGVVIDLTQWLAE